MTGNGDALLPQPPGGNGTGAALSLAVHVGLIAALAFGVGWRMKAPEAVSAELWSSIPQMAAPRAEEPPAPTPAPPPPPPPPPVKEATPPAPDPKIAIERERRAREEKERAERAAEEAKKKKAAEEAKKAEAEEKKKAQAEEKKKAEERKKAEQAKLDKLREEQMQRMLGTLQGSGAPGSTGTAARSSGPSASYGGKIVARVRPNIVFADTLPGNPAAEVEVRAAAGGTILSRRLLKSSGVKDWDDAVLRAIDKTGSLPPDTDGRVPEIIIITFRPNE